MATVNEGDEVIISAPYWVSYPDIVLLCGGVPVIVTCGQEQSFKLPAADLAEAITPRTRWVILNSPSNPSGAGYTENEIRQLAEVLKENPHVLVMADDIYEHLVYDDFRFFTPAQIGGDLAERVLTCNGMSKAYCMTGWRMGYILSANSALMEQVTKLQYYITACSTDAMQYGVLAAIEQAPDYPSEMRDAFRQRRDLICARLNTIPGVSCHVPEGAFYVFPKVNVPGWSSVDIALEILKEGVVCSPGSAFGTDGEGHLRFAYTIDVKLIDQAMDIVQKVLTRLHQAEPPEQPAQF